MQPIESLRRAINEIKDQFPSMSMCIDRNDFINQRYKIYMQLSLAQEQLIEKLEAENAELKAEKERLIAGQEKYNKFMDNISALQNSDVHQ